MKTPKQNFGLHVATPKGLAHVERQNRLARTLELEREAKAREIAGTRDANKRDRQDAIALLVDEHGLAAIASLDAQIEELRAAWGTLRERGFSKEWCAAVAETADLKRLKVNEKEVDDLDLFIEGRISFAKQIMGRKPSLAAISREVPKYFPNKSRDAVRQRIKRALRARKAEPIGHPLPPLP